MIEGRDTPKDTPVRPVPQTFVCSWHDSALEARSLVAAAWLTKVGQSEGPRSGRMGVERGHYSEEAGACSMGRGHARPWALLYVAPKLSASAIGAYPHDV